jgi:purine-binding chemotaxis protein CheW
VTVPRTPQDVLESRARHLAQPLQGTTATGAGVEMLVFSVGRERYAVESRFIFAVVQLADLVPLPGALAPVVGVTRWRGDVLTVLDLRRVVGGVPGALDDLGRLIVMGETAPEFGVLADVLDGLSIVDPAALHPLRRDRVVEIPGLVRGVTSDAVHALDAAVLIAHQSRGSQQPLATTPPSTSVSQ